MKTAVLFSGQGSQYPGMGIELYKAFPEETKEIIDTADEVFNFNILNVIQNSSSEELSQTKISQPTIFTVSLIALAAAKKRGLIFEGTAGHSLGEYAALTASGIISMKDACTAIKHRAEAMDKAAKENPGAMAAVIGLSGDKICEICESIRLSGDYVSAVNFNSPVQTVIAGACEGIAKASDALKAAGAKRIMPLAVSAAFHSDFMKPAAKEFKEAIKNMVFNSPKIKFYSNLTGKELSDFSNMPELMGRHICSPVRFTEELTAMKNDGFERFIELGPGKILTGLVNKTLEGVTALNVENLETLNKL